MSKDKIKDHPDAKLVIATTGAQGEPMAGLARMANRDHRFVEIQPGDTVIVSASPIPGNEEYVSRTIDNLFKAGANVYYHTIKRAHVSGHASQEELKLMLGLTKPKHFIPIHGEFRMQVQHGRLAIETGVAPENVFIIENGTPIELYADGSARRASPVTAGYVYVDGLSVGEVGDVVLRDRRSLANDGMFMIVVTIDKQTGSVIGRPEIITRGFVHLNELDPLMEEAVNRVMKAIDTPGDHISEVGAAQGAGQGRRVALPVRADQATTDGLPGRGRGLTWQPVAERRPASRRPGSRSRRANAWASRLTPDVVRSILGLFLLILGAMTLIALLPAGQGALTSWWTDLFAPWFGRLRWLLPFFLLASDWWLEWGPGKRPGSGGGSPSSGSRSPTPACSGRADRVGDATGGRIGRFLAGPWATCFGPPAPSSCWLPLPHSASSSGLASRSASCSTPRSARRAGSARRPQSRCAGRHPTTDPRRPGDRGRRPPTDEAGRDPAPAAPVADAIAWPDRRLGRWR